MALTARDQRRSRCEAAPPERPDAIRVWQFVRAPKQSSEIKRIGDLELQDDVPFQERSWRVQRMGQVAVAVFFLAGILGVFGGGLLGTVRRTDPTGALHIEYPRFMRTGASYQLRLDANAAAAERGGLTVWVDARTLEKLAVESVAPQPRSVTVEGGRYVYQFAAAGQGRLAPVVFQVRTRGIGRAGGLLGAGDQAAIGIRCFIYP